MYSLKKVMTLTISCLAAIGCLTVGTLAMNSFNATSGETQINSNGSVTSKDHHNFVGGGEWWWGVNDSNGVYSNYQHNSMRHSSTVKASYENTSGIKNPREMAYAYAPKGWWIDHCYWNTH